MENESLFELIQQTTQAMKLLGYSEKTIQAHRRIFDKLTSFAELNSEDSFSEILGTRFLKEKYEYPPNVKITRLPGKTRDAANAIRKLGEYQGYGGFVKRGNNECKTDWALDDYHFVNAFVKKMGTSDTVEQTKTTNLFRIKKFYDFLNCRGIASVKNIPPKTISEYALSMQGDARRYAQDKLYSLRQYLSYLYKNDHIEVDLSTAVPRIVAPRNKNIPAIWSNDELKKLLGSMDRSSPAGKRDYAVLVLTAELGLRASDVGNLKLSNLNWDRKEIEVSQHKTGVINICPMTDEIGWALIDYIRFARPKSDLPYVFLTCNAPYSKFGDTTAVTMLKRKMQQCGIHESTAGISKGMHSLRHTLARKLLEKDVPLELIADIMGHTQVKSSSPYLKVDINGLRGCALSLQEVRDYV